MPAKNSIKEYQENSYYHLYNRGVEKRTIFLEEQDYGVFLAYLKHYLLPKDIDALRNRLSDQQTPYGDKDSIIKQININNFYGEISLLAFCLMPNHFHLLIKQKSSGSIDRFMNSLGTRYTMYFNKKYHRVGKLYQGVYKAVLVKTDEQLLELSRYIHFQALGMQGVALHARQGDALHSWKEVQPSSFPYYQNNLNYDWLDKQTVLDYFSSKHASERYEAFVLRRDYAGLPDSLIIEIEA